MSQKSRYLLLALLFAVFLGLAPLILLYVGGISYDFHKKAFVKTGILAIRAEPKDANVFINGKKTRSSSGDIKFLAPGDYDVSLRLEGYRTWSKSLNVKENEVTWVSPAPNDLFLFLADNKPAELAGGVSDFASDGHNLLYLTAGKAGLASFGSASSSQFFALPKSANEIAASRSSWFLLRDASSSTSQATLVFNSDSKQFSDISSLFSAQARFEFADSGQLLALDGGILYRVNLSPPARTPIIWNIANFTLLGDRVYFLRQGESSASLEFAPLAGGAEQLLVGGIPLFSQSRILVTPQKQIILRLNSALYAVNSGLTRIQDSISEINFERDASMLASVSGGELDWFDYSAQKMNFITRSSQDIAQPQVRPAVNLAFFRRNDKLVAVELDTRDRQNEYDFYSGMNLKKIAVDGEGKYAAVLDGNALKLLSLR